MTRIEIVVFDGWDELDAIAPFEVLRQGARRGAAIDCELVTLDRPRAVEGANGLRLYSTSVLGTPDWLVVPGGGWVSRAERGAWGEAQRGALPAALASARRSGVLLASVCTGAMLLASAGLLDGRDAVTHHSALQELAAAGARTIDARVVDDGELVTAGGVTSGLDLGLHLLARIDGAELADAIAKEMEITRGRVHFGVHGDAGRA